MRKAVLIALVSSLVLVAQAEIVEEPLWPDGAPGAKGDGEADVPKFLISVPENPNGTSVVVCPGGGYGHLAKDHEGYDIANWLNERGIAAFILWYRIAPDYGHPIPLTDVRRAIQTVRARVDEWGLNPDRIGIIGFSAGGHLTASSCVHPVPGDPDAKDPIERVSSRPDFACLMYPVITMQDPHTHKGSRRNLLGENPSADLMKEMSNELQVDENTPPAFIIHTTNDGAVPVQNAVLYYSALVEHGVIAEMHIYDDGRHGLGLGDKEPHLPYATWPDLWHNWMRYHRFVVE